MFRNIKAIVVAAAIALCAGVAAAQQQPSAAKVRLGSSTAKNGFINETEIAAKFNDWRSDADAAAWLAFMGHKAGDIVSVTATKPHGEKADVEVAVRTARGERREGISIKLVSGPTGFNQIDKRWLSHYAEMWRMPPDVVAALRLFVGETEPATPGRQAGRTYLSEMDPAAQKKIVDFFTIHKAEIVSDLFEGDGAHSAKWILVALKSEAKPRWVLRSMDYAKKFFGEGKVEITARGNLKIGRITVQRKGGDGGRETANMLQFKINPALLFDAD